MKNKKLMMTVNIKHRNDSTNEKMMEEDEGDKASSCFVY